MTMPKKGRRKITVDGVVYYWKTRINRQQTEYLGADTFQIDVILLIEHSQYPSSHVIASFIGKKFWAIMSSTQTISITSAVVRSVIQCALRNGWKPLYDKRNFLIKNAEQIFPEAVLSEVEDDWDDYIQTIREYYQNYTEPISSDLM